MQLLTVLSTLLLAGSAFAARATYDNTYDNPAGSMWGVACSNGKNGLAEKYPTFGDIPSFPNVGGVPGVTWNSTKCGSCWRLQYQGVNVYVTAIDYAGSTFNIAQAALDTLTDGHAVEWGSVEIDAKEVELWKCGMD